MVVDAGVVETLAKLQSLSTSLGGGSLDLPQIVVLGSQSSGKSSAIEALVGISFLPRGTGIVTRCPLLLHLRPREAAEGRGDFAVFEHAPQTFRDFGAVRAEIAARTNVLAGDGKGICKTPIVLRIHAAGAPALTLVDLPGATRVAVRGQDEGVGAAIRDLCLGFAANPRAILLCVSAANADLANSDSLMLAREVDRPGDRTIGVLTKVDLCDDGDDAAAVLRNEVLPLSLGFVAIVCPGARADAAGAADARRRERAFFAGRAATYYAGPEKGDFNSSF